jgi:hypothetical protein
MMRAAMPRLPFWTLVPAVAALLPSACGGGEEHPGRAKREHRRVLLSTEVDGLSGLTVDDAGRLHAVAERDRVLLTIEGARVVERTRLAGVPDGLDTEAVAWLGEGRFAVGTESQHAGRASDAVLIVDRGRVVETIEVPYRVLGIRPEDNDGIEGICVAADRLFVAVEHALEGPERQAVVAWRPLAGGAWASGRVHLTSAVGKLSALSCRGEAERVVLHAIERGRRDGRWVGRIVRFRAPRPGASVRAEVAVDLAGLAFDRPNPEGLVVRGGRATVVIDNHYRVRTGPTALIEVRDVR